MEAEFVVDQEYRTAYRFVRRREGATTKEFMYLRKQTLLAMGIDPQKGVTIAQYASNDGDRDDTR